MPSAVFIQMLNTRTIDREGTDVTLATGQTLKAILVSSDHELLRSDRGEGDASEKRPLVLIFGSHAWGIVLENMKISVGGDVPVTDADGKTSLVSMRRTMLVLPPLHPKWMQNIVTELAVVASPE